MKFPTVRMQRYRQSPAMRKWVAESFLQKKDFIVPLFVSEILKEKQAVVSMPNVYQHSLDSLLQEVERLVNLGISSVMLFGIPEHKDAGGSSSYDEKGIIQQSIALIKKEFPQVIVMADCCLCEYTSHGHCGIMHQGKLKNDETLATLQKVALSYALSGADVIAPSGMMDGMVSSIRHVLDENDFEMTAIMSYAVKYASSFYSPFREAAGSGDVFQGNRKHHQMAPSQSREALREALLDVEEGADYLMVKPGLPYLDIVKLVKEKTLHPLAVYHTSGEYAMVKAAAKAGVLDEKAAFIEIYLGMKRAGADWILSYYADEMANIIDHYEY
jgi:porphobilinogen synthase